MGGQSANMPAVLADRVDLFSLVYAGELDALRLALLQRPTELHLLDRHGDSLLHLAIRRVDTAAVRCVLAAGFDVNTRSAGNWTPMEEAMACVQACVGADAAADVKAKAVAAQQAPAAERRQPGRRSPARQIRATSLAPNPCPRAGAARDPPRRAARRAEAVGGAEGDGAQDAALDARLLRGASHGGGAGPCRSTFCGPPPRNLPRAGARVEDRVVHARRRDAAAPLPPLRHVSDKPSCSKQGCLLSSQPVRCAP